VIIVGCFAPLPQWRSTMRLPFSIRRRRPWPLLGEPG